MEKPLKQGKKSAFWCGAHLRLQHFGCSSTKMGNHTVAQDAGSCQALSASPIPREDPTSEAVSAAWGAHFTPLQ